MQETGLVYPTKAARLLGMDARTFRKLLDNKVVSTIEIEPGRPMVRASDLEKLVSADRAGKK